MTTGTLTREQKKEMARLLYTREYLTRKETAERVGVAMKTMCAWVKDGNWDQLRQSMITTREEQLRRMYAQLDELNTEIMSREPGKRFANSKEADTITKLTAAIASLERDTSIADIISVSKMAVNKVRAYDPVKARELADVFDMLIKDALKNG